MTAQHNSLRARLTGFFGAFSLPSPSPSFVHICLAIFFCALAAVISCGGDFPLNDDWAYGETTRTLLSTGRFYAPAACAPAFSHILLGALFSKVLGFSYVSLRCSVAVTGMIGVYFVYLSLLELDIHRRESLFCTLVYAANPIMVNLYLGFMSDVPALSLCAIYFFTFLAGLKRRSLPLIWLSLLVLLLAISVRQSAVILAAAAPALLLARMGSGKQRLLTTIVYLILPVFAFIAVDKWLVVRDASGQSIVSDYANARAGHALFVSSLIHQPGPQLLKLVAALGVVSCYIGLFTAPIVMAFFASALASSASAAGRKKVRRWCLSCWPIFALSLIVCLISAFYQTQMQHALMPFCENILRFTSVGAQGLMGIANPILTHRQKIRLTVASYILASFFLFLISAPISAAFWRVKNALASASTAAVLDRLQRALSPRLFVVLASTAVTLAFVTVETIVRCTDRYYLIALLPCVMALALFARIVKAQIASPFGTLLLLLFVYYGLAAGQDYLSANAARWKALIKLEAQGIKSDDIDGGAEYNILRDMPLYASHYRGEPPRNSWRWWPVKGEIYIVSFSPVPDYEEAGKETYFSLLTMSEHPVYALKSLKLNK